MPENPAADLSLAGFSAERARLLRVHAADYSRLAVDNIAGEFSSGIHYTMNEPGDFPYRPRERTPVFFGSFDWHSCVEMHWLVVRLLRTTADAVQGPQIRQVLDRQFTPEALVAGARECRS